MKPLEKSGKAKIESEKTVLASEEKTPVKKKTKIVKRIVKKKVIRKVPKRVSVALNSNELGKVASPNPNDNAPMEIEAVIPLEIEKSNVDVNDASKVEYPKEFAVDDREKGVSLIENNDSDSDTKEMNGLLTASPLVDRNRIELHDREDDINMDVERHEHDEGLKVHDENIECVGVKIEAGLEECVKEQVEKTELIDSKPSDAVEDQDKVNEPIEITATDDSIAEQGLSERTTPNGETVASGRPMKQKTKIFIHGLDKETKEEDIKKVFEDIGEVLEVKLITNLRSGKSRGFGFIRYASADHAKLALTKYHTVEICGSLCTTAAIEGKDTILLKNIDKKWNSEHVLELLQKIGIERIEEVSVVGDSENTELNCGFAYIELETKKDAQLAFHKLQNKYIFGKHSQIQVSWADPLGDPVDEEMPNIKSVYAEHIPSSWEENEVKNHFKIFGEIESIALAKNLRTAKRSDFAFINFKKCESAHSCIEALTSKKSTINNGPQLKVSLSKSIPKGKPFKTISEPAVTVVSKVMQNANQSRFVFKPHNPRNMEVSSIIRHEESRKDKGSSTTAELVQILREQASWKQGGPTSTTTTAINMQGRNSLSYHHDPRGYHQTHLQIPPVVPHPRPIVNGVAMSSFPRYDQQRAHYTNGSSNGNVANPRFFQTRDQATYPGSSSSSIFRQMH